MISAGYENLGLTSSIYKRKNVSFFLLDRYVNVMNILIGIPYGCEQGVMGTPPYGGC